MNNNTALAPQSGVSKKRKSTSAPKKDPNVPAIRVLLVDDHTLFREGVRQLCESKCGLDVVGEAKNGAEAVDMALRLKPDVILMDIDMPIMDGVLATKAILARQPSAKVIFLTMFADDKYMFSAIKAGALGYILKDIGWEELMHAVNTVYHDEPLLKPSMVRQLMQEIRKSNDDRDTEKEHDKLTDAEIKILNLLSQGLDNDEIANQLSLAKKTVANRLTDIYQKIETSNRTQAALYAISKGYKAK